ncbi:MAG: class I SAM-dependent methyltransferase [Promethearchaeota archaeon]
MISPVLSNKTLKRIKKIFPIDPAGKIFLPIIINPINIENLLKFFSNKFIASIPNYVSYSRLLENQFIAKELSKNNIEFKIHFFGISSTSKFEKITGTIIIFPINLSLDLINYALNQLFNLLSHPSFLLIIVSNEKQRETILNWLEDTELEYSKVKSQDKSLFVIPKFNPADKIQSEIKDFIFKINYKKDYGELEFFSADGVFSKDKVDDGTDFLIDTIINEGLISKNAEIIDYFAGIGIIGITLSKFTDLRKIHFIESDLISIFLLKRNLKHYQITNSIVHEMDGLIKPNIAPETIDFIVANPPTHIKKDDFKKFLQISKKLLKSQGKLIIVINNIIPYERSLKEHFPNPSNIISFKKGKYKIIIS